MCKKKKKNLNCDVCKSTTVEVEICERAKYVPPPPLVTYSGKSPFSQANLGRKEILSNDPKFNNLETKSRIITFWLYLSLIVLGIVLGLSFAILSKIFD